MKCKLLSFAFMSLVCFSIVLSDEEIVTMGLTSSCILLQDDNTGERGYVIRMVNRTGYESVKGQVVSNCDSCLNAFRTQSENLSPIGVVQESGVSNGALTWIWKTGSRARVMWQDNVPATIGYVAFCSSEDGRAEDSDNTIPPPISDLIIGNTAETNAGGTNVLNLVDLQF